MTSGHRSLGHLVVLPDANLSALLLCHTGNISARYKHCTIASPISAIMIINVSAMTSGHRSLGHLVAPTHGEYPGEIQASQDSIVNQAYHCHTCLGEDISADQLPNDYMCLGEL